MNSVGYAGVDFTYSLKELKLQGGKSINVTNAFEPFPGSQQACGAPCGAPGAHSSVLDGRS